MEDHFREFLTRMSDVELMSRQVKQSINTDFETMTGNHQSLIDNGMEDHSKSLHNMFFRALTNGEPIFYDHTSRDFEQRTKDLINRKNKHYLWLLAEAFEYFEDLIEIIYAHIGHKDFDAWPTKEKRNALEATLETKPFEWYLQISENNKSLNTKLECIRIRFPALVVIEKKNHFGIDLRFTINQIEMMRHMIVHNSGKIKNKDLFVKRIFEQSGIANNGNYAPEKLQQINNFVDVDEQGHGHKIIMLEIQQRGTPFHIDRLGAIITWLLGYSDYIYTKLIKPTYFSQ